MFAIIGSQKGLTPYYSQGFLQILVGIVCQLIKFESFLSDVWCMEVFAKLVDVALCEPLRNYKPAGIRGTKKRHSGDLGLSVLGTCCVALNPLPERN